MGKFSTMSTLLDPCLWKARSQSILLCAISILRNVELLAGFKASEKILILVLALVLVLAVFDVAKTRTTSTSATTARKSSERQISTSPAALSRILHVQASSLQVTLFPLSSHDFLESSTARTTNMPLNMDTENSGINQFRCALSNPFSCRRRKCLFKWTQVFVLAFSLSLAATLSLSLLGFSVSTPLNSWIHVLILQSISHHRLHTQSLAPRKNSA